MIKEIKGIKNGFGHTYAVSDDGKVYNQTTGRELKGRPQKKGGYLRVNLAGKDYKIHRLVAEAFVPNPENKEQVNHINGKTDDNRAENLEWVSPSENICHAYANGLMTNVGEKNRNSKITEKQALEIKNSSESNNVLGKRYGLSPRYIARIKGGHAWKHL